MAGTILCWVDAGPAIGLGHLSRALALAEAAAAHGLTCRFALPPDPTALRWLTAAGMAAPILLPERGAVLPQVLAAAAAADAVIVDVRHRLAVAEVRALGARCPVLVIDNAGAGTAFADLVLAPFGAPPERHRHWLAGPAYVPLRRALRAAPRVRPVGERPRVLVSMGASDPGGLAVQVVDALADAQAAGTPLDMCVLANPAMPVWTELTRRLAELGMPAPRPGEPAAIATELSAADLAVVAMGVTVYEAMACGVPPVVLCRTDGDVAHARALATCGAIENAGMHWTVERIAAAVGRLAAAPATRATMAHAGTTLVDGRGAERVLARLGELMVAEGRRMHAGIGVGA